jgi:hypothetical protein
MNSRRTGLLGTARFTLRRIKPVSLDYPPPDRTYSGLDASRRPDLLRWSSEESPRESRFILARNAALTDTVIVLTNPPRSIRLPRLPAGNYFWTVQAESAGGFDISAPAPAGFRVLPIPPLPAPENRLPPEGFTLGPAELWNSRTVLFTWDEVTGANGYIFTLYLEEGKERRRIIEADTGAKTEYVLENLSLLSAGEFVWQVRGINRTGDGRFEQPGTIGENRFTLNLPPIPRNRLPKPGALYAR